MLPSDFNLDAKGPNQERGLSIQIGGAQAKIPTIAVAHGSIPNESSIVRDWKLVKGSRVSDSRDMTMRHYHAICTAPIHATFKRC